jgi:hypothetical protein
MAQLALLLFHRGRMVAFVGLARSGWDVCLRPYEGSH